MKTLIVGGTGMIGGYIALGLRRDGHDVTLAARNPAPEGTPLTGFPLIRGSYVDGDFTRAQLAGFDALVFAAGNDIRQAPRGAPKAEEEAFYRRANSEGVPRFIALAKAAGVRRCAYIGSFYPQARPELVGPAGYVRSRLDADEGARALADADFHVVSLNAPWVVGEIPGLTPLNYRMMAEWALGRRDFPLQAAPGGTNFISVESLYRAVVGALARGDNGRGYLVGDENLHFADFFGLFFKAAGRDAQFEIVDAPMPLMHDAALFAGRAATLFYEPEGAEQLGYPRHDVARTVSAIVQTARAGAQA